MRKYPSCLRSRSEGIWKQPSSCVIFVPKKRRTKTVRARQENGLSLAYRRLRQHYKIYERRIDIGLLTDDQAKALLRALVAKAGLTFDEMVGAHARRKTRIANPLLEVRREGPYAMFTRGDNPRFIISARLPDGVIVGKSQTAMVLRKPGCFLRHRENEFSFIYWIK